MQSFIVSMLIKLRVNLIRHQHDGWTFIPPSLNRAPVLVNLRRGKQKKYFRNLKNSFSCFFRSCLDICKDSSDDDYSDGGSSQTEGYAVMDVIEYEIPDDSESDDVSSASSGTDDFTYEAATAACFEFNALINGHLTDDDDEEYILADTEEESDGSVDLELGHADYWKCVKCNNPQNNPMYRYCERCYQVSPVERPSIKFIRAGAPRRTCWNVFKRRLHSFLFSLSPWRHRQICFHFCSAFSGFSFIRLLCESGEMFAIAIIKTNLKVLQIFKEITKRTQGKLQENVEQSREEFFLIERQRIFGNSFVLEKLLFETQKVEWNCC